MCLAFIFFIFILCTFQVIYINSTQFLFYGTEYCTVGITKCINDFLRKFVSIHPLI